jgi:hypothetical protein
MTASATRPANSRPHPMMDELDLAWITIDGYWLGVPESTTPEMLQRAFDALEWLTQRRSVS